MWLIKKSEKVPIDLCEKLLCVAPDLHGSLCSYMLCIAEVKHQEGNKPWKKEKESSSQD